MLLTTANTEEAGKINWGRQDYNLHFNLTVGGKSTRYHAGYVRPRVGITLMRETIKHHKVAWFITTVKIETRKV